MNDDVISRSALKKALDSIDWYCKARGGILVSGAPSEAKAYFKATDIYNAIDKAPTIEPKKGKWITDGLHNTVCSICGGIRRDGRFEHINFCNKCGTPMER